VTINMMQTAISSAYQRGIEVGRDSMKREIDELYQLNIAFSLDSSFKEAFAETPKEIGGGNGPRKRPGHAVKVSGAVPKEFNTPKASATTSGVKKHGAPRTKGVKDRILGLLASGVPMTISTIVAQTLDKETSVAGTLQGLKKKGFAAQDENKRWYLIPPGSGNSETAAHVDG
jgi:hypothetical protein